LTQGYTHFNLGKVIERMQFNAANDGQEQTPDGVNYGAVWHFADAAGLNCDVYGKVDALRPLEQKENGSPPGHWTTTG